MRKSFSSKFKLTRQKVFAVERLESRVLYSADSPFAGDLLVNDDLDSFSGDELALIESLQADIDEVRSDASSEILYVIDVSIENYELLVESLGDSTQSNIILVQSGNSGIEVVSDALQNKTNVSELHIISHASEGELRLGSDRLDTWQLENMAAELSLWGKSLTEDADLLIYGCDLAAGSGEDWVQLFAELTGADIAASTNQTGSASLGGDWELEHQVGKIEAEADSLLARVQPWEGVLGNINVTTDADVLDGDTSSVTALLGNPGLDGLVSLREAIIASNNTAGDENITLGSGTPSLVISTLTAIWPFMAIRRQPQR